MLSRLNQYGDANRLLRLSQGASRVSFAYDSGARWTSVTLANGVTMNYNYDVASQLLGTNYQLGNTVVGNLTYTYDLAGNRTTVGGSYAQTHLPSALANASFNADNQLTLFGSSNLAYDANGNLTSDGSRTYTWDARNHLVSISGGVSASFQYDPFGRRVAKTVGTATTNYLYDGINPAQELSGGSPTANLLTGLNVDEYFQRTDASGPANFLTDGLGSTIALTGPGGNPVTQYTYDPYGSTTITGNSTNPYQFTGRENDGTGLYYYRARYYTPALSRFVSEDPWGFGAGVDFYAYAFDNPLQWADPSGLDVLRCERPLNIPAGRNLACHTFLFSTQSNSGWGLTTASTSGSVWTFGTGGSAPGKLEPDDPFPPGQPHVIGRYKPGYSCSDVSKDKCVEKCVNANFRPPFPDYQVGKYQCAD